MDKALVPTSSSDLITFDDDKIGLIKRTIAKDATDDELALFLHQAQKTGLDPLAKQIYFQKYNTRSGPQIAIITGIDGYRLVASRTGVYAGNDAPVFDGRINYAGRDVPAKATVTVWRIVGNRRMPFAASVYWDEYCPDPPRDYQWKKMPHVMLAKCAEAAALRKAFPADLSGVYTHEEMQQADFVVIDAPSVEIEQPEIKLSYTDPEPVDSTDDPARMDVETIRNDLSRYTKLTGVQVADCAISTGKYNSREHVENALKHHDGFAKSGGKLSAGVSSAVGLDWFDWLMERKSE